MKNRLKDIFFKRISKAIIDILLIMGLILAIISAHSAESSWWSFHCIVSMVWYALMIVHIWQHWGMTKAVFKWKVLKRNKITFITIVFFILLTFSIILFMIDVNDQFIRIHHAIASPLRIVIVIHTVQKWKQFLVCFR
jgi:hypothetical protein